MKEINAYIKKHKLHVVTRALRKIDGLTGMSIIESSGFGHSWREANGEPQIDSLPGVKLEIICQDELVEEVVSTIEKAAHTGLTGDGKIYINSVEQTVRISTGERSNTTA